jgi:hypothetical protein
VSEEEERRVGAEREGTEFMRLQRRDWEGRARREAINTCTQNANKEPTIVRRVTQHEEVVERFVIQASIALVCPHSSQETTSASN